MCARESNPGHLVLLRPHSFPLFDSGRQLLKGNICTHILLWASHPLLKFNFTTAEGHRQDVCLPVYVCALLHDTRGCYRREMVYVFYDTEE